MRIPESLVPVALGLAAAAIVTACGPAHTSATSSAHAAASALATNTYAQQDKAKLEAALTANFQKDFDPAHPVKSVEAAVHATFPNHTGQIETYAVKTFKPADAKAGPVRQAYLQSVVVYAQSQGATP